MTRVAPEDIPGVMLEVAERLRGVGYRISTAEVVKASRLAIAYSRLAGGLDKHDLSYIIKASFTVADPEMADIEHAVRSVLSRSSIRERAEKISEQLWREVQALGLKPGSDVSRKRISRKPKKERKTAMASYLRLKRLGAISGGPGRERLADARELERLAWALARRGYESVEEALRDARFSWSWDDLLMHAEGRVPVSSEVLSRASEARLLRMAEAARRKGDRRLHRAIAEELASRALRGEVRRKGEVSQVLREEGLLTPSLRKRLAEGIDEDDLTLEEVAVLAQELGREEGGRLVARKMKSLGPDDALRLASMVDPSLLWASRPPRKGGPGLQALEAAINAARALREAILYAETGEEGRADLAYHYIAKSRNSAGGVGRDARIDMARVESVIREAEAIIELSESVRGEPGRGSTARDLVDRLVAKLDFSTSIRVLRSAYRLASPSWKAIIEDAMERLLYRYASREGLRLLPEQASAPRPPGRLNVRNTLYNFIRWKSRPFEYRRRLRASPLSLALDASGSMLEYAAWSISIASLFPRHLRRLVVFRESAEVYEGPIPRGVLARILLSTRFRGFTNISEGLLQASTPGVRRIVAVTDLHQTVDARPVDEAVSELRARGRRVLFIVPPGHDHDTRRLVEKAGARVLVAGSPREAARHLLRALLR